MNSLLISKRKTKHIECHKSFNFELKCLPCNNNVLKAYLIFLSKLRELCSLHNVSKNVSGRRRCRCHPNGCSSAPTCSSNMFCIMKCTPTQCQLLLLLPPCAVCSLAFADFYTKRKRGQSWSGKGVETGGGSEVCGTACPRDLHRR